MNFREVVGGNTVLGIFNLLPLAWLAWLVATHQPLGLGHVWSISIFIAGFTILLKPELKLSLEYWGMTSAVGFFLSTMDSVSRFNAGDRGGVAVMSLVAVAALMVTVTSVIFMVAGQRADEPLDPELPEDFYNGVSASNPLAHSTGVPIPPAQAVVTVATRNAAHHR